MAGKNYRDLIAWQKAMELVMLVYRVHKEPAQRRNLWANESNAQGSGINSF